MRDWSRETLQNQRLGEKALRATEKKIFIHLSLLSLTQKEKQNQSDGKSTAYNSLYMITLSS